MTSDWPTGASNTAHAYLDAALNALLLGSMVRRAALNALPVPIYLTDPDGLVTFWNRACVEFAGRQPQLGKDRWCISWILHTPADELLPHDCCPMAMAIKERRSIRGEIAIAMRPDGSRKAFAAYPTPLFSEDGELIGAINMLIDVTADQVPALHEQAERCNRLASAITDRYTANLLRGMAQGYERNSASLRAKV